MSSKLATVALGFSTSIFALTAYAQTPPTTAPITDIRLSSGGLAEVRRQVEVKDNAAVTLTVPLDQVDDVLKSLTIRDPKGSASSASLAGKQPLAEVFKNLPFSATDLSSQAALISALQGAAVTVAGDGRETKGRVVGVEETKIQGKNDETITNYRLTVFSGGKLTGFDLDKVDVALDDEALRAKLESGLNAVQAAKAGDARDIAVAVAGSGPRSIAIDYVVPAPIWKATYRLTLPKDGDKADIQGWAVIENNSSDDWKNVRLSLSSGSPVTLHQRLHEAYYAKRPEVPVYGPNGIVPLADKGGEISQEQSEPNASRNDLPSRKRAAPAYIPPAAPVPVAPPSDGSFVGGAVGHNYQNDGRVRADSGEEPYGRYANRTVGGQLRYFTGGKTGTSDDVIGGRYETSAPAQQQEADTTSLFTLSNPITLKRGQSLTLPFLTARMSASRVSVFQPQLGIANPVAAIMVKNEGTASLPPGILTLTEDGSGYAGDAQLAGLPAGETRMVMFATDRKVVITSDGKGDQRLSQITFDNGALKTEIVTQANVTYKIKGAADADRTIIVEYPRRQGFTYVSDQKESETPTAIRLKVTVSKGSVAEAKLTEQQVVSVTYTIADVENRGQMLGIWSQQATANPQLLTRIKDASDAVAALNEAKQNFTRYDIEVNRINTDQERIRNNLRAVPSGSDLAKTYLATMTTQEARLVEITSLRQKSEEAIVTARKVLSEKLKAF